MVFIQRKQGSFFMCIKIYETILPLQYKITALSVNFRNDIITHHELRIKIPLTKRFSWFIMG